MGKCRGADASNLKLNLSVHCRTQYHASTPAEGCQAGRLGQLLQYYVEEG